MTIKDKLVKHIREMDAKIAGGMLLDDEDYTQFYWLCQVCKLESWELELVLKEARQ